MLFLLLDIFLNFFPVPFIDNYYEILQNNFESSIKTVWDSGTIWRVIGLTILQSSGSLLASKVVDFSILCYATLLSTSLWALAQRSRNVQQLATSNIITRKLTSNSAKFNKLFTLIELINMQKSIKNFLFLCDSLKKYWCLWL